MKSKYIKLLIIVFFVICIDQVSKLLITRSLYLTENVVLIKDFLNITFYANTGAAFGILQSGRIFLICSSFLFLAYLIFELRKNINNNLMSLFLTFVISGLLGNLIDRIFRGYVVDFISFRIFNPIFNVSDIFISVGCALIILLMLKEEVNANKSRKRRNFKGNLADFNLSLPGKK